MPIGSPVSAAIADLVTKYVEVHGPSTFPANPRWWLGYVDDSTISTIEKSTSHRIKKPFLLVSL